MKNFIQRETMNFDGDDLEGYCRFLATTFLGDLSAGRGDAGVGRRDSVRRPARAEPAVRARRARTGARRASRLSAPRPIVEAVSGLRGFRLLRLGGSAFHGFVRDEYTTLPDHHEPAAAHVARPRVALHRIPAQAFDGGHAARRARQIVREMFALVRVGQHPAGDLPDGHRDARRASRRSPRCTSRRTTARGIRLPNAATTLGVYTDARPPYGCLGLEPQAPDP